MSAPLQPEPAPVATPEPPPEDVEADDGEPRFSFYNMLPSFEVIIPEEEPDVSLDDQVKVVEQPGTYVLQAGSFTDAADADRVGRRAVARSRPPSLRTPSRFSPPKRSEATGRAASAPSPCCRPVTRRTFPPCKHWPAPSRMGAPPCKPDAA